MRRRLARLGTVLLVSGRRRLGRLMLNPSASRETFLYPHLLRLFVTILQDQAAACDSMDIDLTSLAPAPDTLPSAGG